ncbi:MAG: hypothetical protein HY923_00035 [Elusimicrobia bacterium]|nr:hypothetical protein [Elusimicrobiota bacterium]
MKYWTYMKGEVPGSYEPAALVALPGFSMTTLVCPGEGEIAEKNWRRAGEFEEIVRAIEAHQAATPPSAPLGAPPTDQPSEVDSLLDTASTRLFSHVADLMKELETRRDEKALIVSLQRQISVLKQELAQSREQTTLLEIRMPRLAELEAAHRKDLSAVSALEAEVDGRDAQLRELHIQAEKDHAALDAAKRRVHETDNDLGIRNRLVDKLSHDLSEKELSLAKALGVIRRLEEDLHLLCPTAEILKARPSAELAQAPAPVRAAAPVVATGPSAPPPPVANQVLSVPEFKTPAPEYTTPAPEAKTPLPDLTSTFTNDDPPPPPPYLEPNRMSAEEPKAQQALMGFLRKVFPGPSH